MHVRLTSEVISPDALRRRVVRPEAGAVAAFEGVVRNHRDEKRVDYIHYEAYDEMAEKEMREVVERAVREFSVCDAAVEHRTGRLEVGDVSVAIAVSAPHRDEAFRACRGIIDGIKRLVPIWKKEGNDEGAEWVEAPSGG
jgi:molybdopterin synthase catalytic subunit